MNLIKTLITHCGQRYKKVLERQRATNYNENVKLNFRMESHKEDIIICLSNLYVDSIGNDGIPNQEFGIEIQEIFKLLKLFSASHEFDVS
jgi:hypothetical protein